jgi:hypothetical protein
VTEYELDDQSSIPGRNKGFFFYPLHPVWLWAHPASYSMGAGGPFPSGKAWPGHDANHLPPSSAEVNNK